MRKILIISLITFCVLYSFGQENEDNKQIKTLFGSVKSNGGYAGLTINFAPINNKDGLFMGGRGCWVIGHGLAIGIGGGGLVNNYHYDNILNDDYHYEGGYGGLYIEPIIFGRFPVHIAFPIMIGIGGVAYTSRYYRTWDGSTHNIEDINAFLVTEPGAELEFNMLKHFRLSFGVYYRYTSEIDLYNTAPNILNGFSGGITFKFGKF